MYFLVGRFLGPGIAGLPGRRRQQGLFTAPNERDALEFGYCFDVRFLLPFLHSFPITNPSHQVSTRAFFSLYTLLYVLQFILMPLLARQNLLSTFVADSLYLAAFTYYTLITFLGYNALPFLQHTEMLLLPMGAWGIWWLVSVLGMWNMSLKITPGLIFWGVGH